MTMPERRDHTIRRTATTGREISTRREKEPSEFLWVCYCHSNSGIIHFSGQGLDAFCNPKINYNISSITGTIRRGVASPTLNN